MILVLAGTSEGREAALRLQQSGYEILASVTSSYGRDLLMGSGVGAVRQGALEMPELLELLRKASCKMIVDATHPYAAVISQFSMEAAGILNIDYVRLERPAEILPKDVLAIQRLEELAHYLYPGCRLMSTIGSKFLPQLLELSKTKQAHLIARFLPSSGVLAVCESLGMSPEQIVAMKGPFSLEMNQALLKHYRINLVLSKESGAEGGFREKYAAARAMSIPMVVWTRPSMEYPRVVENLEELEQYIKTRKGCL